jgi:pyruvate,orthophosphate dikinase
VRFVYPFDYKHRKPPKDMRDLLGGKGANLAEMTSVLRLPVPPGFTITTQACRLYMDSGWPAGLSDQVEAALLRLEKQMGKRLGAASDPLLVSVRSGAKFSMPGMMDTVLNLGLNDRSVLGLAKATSDERFAYDSYRRFLAMFGRIVLSIPQEDFDEPLEEEKKKEGVDADSRLSPQALKRLVETYKQVIERHSGKPFPQEPRRQLRAAIEAVFRSWNSPRAIAYREKEKIPHDLGTAVNVQAMVFGNRDDNSGTGVGFTRNPATGEKGMYGDFLVNAQGEDVVAGIRNPEPITALKDRFPKVFKELADIFDRLERHFKDMCDVEFTIESGRLWILQTRSGKRTGRAALRIAIDLTKDKRIRLSKQEAVLRVSPDHVEQVMHPQFATRNYTVLTKGLGASPGAAVGKVVFSADEAAELGRRGERVILVRPETSPDDVHGMLAAQGILTARGGLVSHAAVVARGWGKPAVVGAASVRIEKDAFYVGTTRVDKGEVISIDGSTGDVVLGEVPLTEASASKELETVLSWADSVRKAKLGVRANADTEADAALAARWGAEGIGLCRTEHMFFGDERLPVVRRFILASSSEEEKQALEELARLQERDFYGVLKAMGGRPVTVRLLDPPLHEFLPPYEELLSKEARGELGADELRMLSELRRWREFNPMLGIRGVRLGVIKPGLYEMQTKALMMAALKLLKEGTRPVIEIMIPLTVSPEEMAEARSWVTSTIEEIKRSRPEAKRIPVAVGTMVETPRAALVAAEIARYADFFSFGTNDLTQMTFGFSRDDVEGRLIPPYLEKGLLAANPFETLDKEGVGQLVALATSAGKQANPRLKVGVCGEHGGEPDSIAAFYSYGVDYVSCSPFRVPVARLAAAHAVLAHREADR